MDELSQAVEMLLNITRSEIADNNPHQALASLLHVIRLTRGEDAILHVLDEAKRKMTADIDEAVMQSKLHEAHRISALLLEQDTVLSESGQQHILRDAFEDGSSVLCSKCGDLVSRARWEAHTQYWCDSASLDVQDMET